LLLFGLYKNVKQREQLFEFYIDKVLYIRYNWYVIINVGGKMKNNTEKDKVLEQVLADIEK